MKVASITECYLEFLVKNNFGPFLSGRLRQLGFTVCGTSKIEEWKGYGNYGS